MLSEQLNCTNIISREVLVKVSEDYGVTEKELTAAMEKPPKFWERSTGNPRHLYLTFIRAALLSYAAKGCMIYHGHAGHFLLSDVNWVLKLRLIAPLEQRIAMLQQSMDIDRYEAEQYINKVDEDRTRWTRFLYSEDWSDPTHFDIVINLKTMSLQTACDTIVKLTQAPEFVRTKERTRDLKNKALEAQVNAAILANPKVRDVNVDISVNDGVVVLTGRLAHKSVRNQLFEIVNGIEGVDEIIDKLLI
jgi:hypothetical protein